MKDDLICPECQHPLGFHSYYESKCEVPVGGPTMYSKCGCTLSLHDLIKILQDKRTKEEIDILRTKNEISAAENKKINKQLTDSINSINKLLMKIYKVKELVNCIKSLNIRLIDGWFVMNYKRQVNQLLDEIILELEK